MTEIYVKLQNYCWHNVLFSNCDLLFAIGNFLYERNCPCNNSENFWVEFHATLTEASTGIITYVTDGEKPGGAFRSDSFFSEHVIPRLNSQMVSRIVAIVVHREGVGKIGYTLAICFSSIIVYCRSYL